MSSLVDQLTGLLSMAIPIIAIVGGISFAAYSMYLKVRRQREFLQMHHVERMAAIEKGIELPPLPPELLHGGDYGVGYRSEYRRWRRGSGVTLVFVGVAITVAMWQTDSDHSFWWGLVIIAWGLGRLVSGHLDASAARPPSASASVPPGSTVNR